MTDLWTESTRDFERETLDHRTASARIALGDFSAYLHSAESTVDHENRLALIAGQIETAVQLAVGDDVGAFPIVHEAVMVGLQADFDVLYQHRQAETQKVNARRAYERNQARQAAAGDPGDPGQCRHGWKADECPYRYDDSAPMGACGKDNSGGGKTGQRTASMNWTTVGVEFDKATVGRAIEGLHWIDPSGSVPMSPGLAIKKAIEEFQIPKVSQIAWESDSGVPGPDGPYDLLGIEGNYANGRVRIYIVDKGTVLIPVCSHVIDGMSANAGRKKATMLAASFYWFHQAILDDLGRNPDQANGTATIASNTNSLVIDTNKWADDLIANGLVEEAPTPEGATGRFIKLTENGKKVSIQGGRDWTWHPGSPAYKASSLDDELRAGLASVASAWKTGGRDAADYGHVRWFWVPPVPDDQVGKVDRYRQIQDAFTPEGLSSTTYNWAGGTVFEMFTDEVERGAQIVEEITGTRPEIRTMPDPMEGGVSVGSKTAGGEYVFLTTDGRTEFGNIYNFDDSIATERARGSLDDMKLLWREYLDAHGGSNEHHSPDQTRAVGLLADKGYYSALYLGGTGGVYIRTADRSKVASKTALDSEGICEACANGNHGNCLGVGCMCIDMEHDAEADRVITDSSGERICPQCYNSLPPGTQTRCPDCGLWFSASKKTGFVTITEEWTGKPTQQHVVRQFGDKFLKGFDTRSEAEAYAESIGERVGTPDAGTEGGWPFQGARRRIAGENPFAKKDDATAPASGEEKKPAEGEEQPTEEAAATDDPSTMQENQPVTISYTLTGERTDAGDVEGTFASFDGTTAWFTYEKGKFGVTLQNGKWVDSAGTVFTFAGGEAPVEEDPNAQQPPAQDGKTEVDTTKRPLAASRRTAGYTFYPHQDSNGNTKPGDFGMVVRDDGEITFPSINFDQAVIRLGDTVVRADYDLPVTVPRAASRRTAAIPAGTFALEAPSGEMYTSPEGFRSPSEAANWAYSSGMDWTAMGVSRLDIIDSDGFKVSSLDVKDWSDLSTYARRQRIAYDAGADNSPQTFVVVQGGNVVSSPLTHADAEALRDEIGGGAYVDNMTNHTTASRRPFVREGLGAQWPSGVTAACVDGRHGECSGSAEGSTETCQCRCHGVTVQTVGVYGETDTPYGVGDENPYIQSEQTPEPEELGTPDDMLDGPAPIQPQTTKPRTRPGGAPANGSSSNQPMGTGTSAG